MLTIPTPKLAAVTNSADSNGLFERTRQRATASATAMHIDFIVNDLFTLLVLSIGKIGDWESSKQSGQRAINMGAATLPSTEPYRIVEICCAVIPTAMETINDTGNICNAIRTEVPSKPAP
jgi:hypothetical protein